MPTARVVTRTVQSRRINSSATAATSGTTISAVTTGNPFWVIMSFAPFPARYRSHTATNTTRPMATAAAR